MSARDAIVGAAFAAVYLASAWLGLGFAVGHENVSPVWPTTGVALAGLLLLGGRFWPAVFFGALVANTTTSAGFVAALGIAAGNCAEAVLGWWLLRRRGFDTLLERQRDVIGLAAAAVVASAVSATAGVTSLVLTGATARETAGTLWWLWWAGDAFGAMIVAPLLLTWHAQPWRHASPRRRLEAAALALSVAVVGAVFFGGLVRLGDSPLSLAYTVFPIGVWASLRFGPPGAAAVNAAVASLCVWATIRGHGPFVDATLAQGIVAAQVFVAVATLTSLFLAAATARRQRAEEGLRASREQLSEVQRVARVGGWSWNVETDVVWWSDELYEIYGTGPGAFDRTYAGFLERVHADDRASVDSTVRAAVARGGAFEVEHRVVLPDGRVRVLHGRGRADVDADGRPVRMVGTAHDITERKHAEEERAALVRAESARAQAEEANRLKDDFLATLSHELRTPLNAIVGWASLLHAGGLDEETGRKAVRTILSSSRALTQLIADVLDVSRIAAGKVQLASRPVDLLPVVEAAIDTVRPSAEARGLELRLDHAGLSPHDRLVADPDRLQQVVWNLLSNAVKFSRPGGTVFVMVRHEGQDLIISVADDGIGIKPEFLPHVFEAFRQADTGTRRAHGGLGLGLSIAHHIVELHGGRLEAHSEGDGRGATFTVRLPGLVRAAEAAAPGAGGEGRDPWEHAPSLSGLRVLAVEDEENSREVLGAMLGRLGAVVRLAGSAAEGLVAVREFRPDVLLSDVEMAGDSGYDLVRRVRALPAAEGGLTPAAAVTAHAGPEHRIRALEAGFELYVAKPLQPDEVALAVAALAARVRRAPA